VLPVRAQHFKLTPLEMSKGSEKGVCERTETDKLSATGSKKKGKKKREMEDTV